MWLVSADNKLLLKPTLKPQKMQNIGVHSQSVFGCMYGCDTKYNLSSSKSEIYLHVTRQRAKFSLPRTLFLFFEQHKY